MAILVPPVHHWKAGDDMNAARMNEIGNAVEFMRNPPMVHVARRLTNQSAAGSGAWTKVSYDTLFNSYDPYDMWDIGTPDTITCKVPGWYEFESTIILSVDSNDTRVIMGVFKNGINALTDQMLRWDANSLTNMGNIAMRKSTTVFLNQGDVLYLAIAWVTAATRNLLAVSDSECPQMRIRWISN